jgi:hypothetical protein
MGRKRTGRRSRTASRGARRGRARTARQERRGPRKSRTARKARRGSKKKMNAYMQALQKARKSKAESFEYKGKTYVRKYAKTGMAIYKAA